MRVWHIYLGFVAFAVFLFLHYQINFTDNNAKEVEYEPKVITEIEKRVVHEYKPVEGKIKECQEKGWDYTLESKMVCSVATPCYYLNYERCTEYSKEWFGTGEEIFWTETINTIDNIYE